MTPDEYEFMKDKRRNMQLDAWVWEAILWLVIPGGLILISVLNS